MKKIGIAILLFTVLGMTACFEDDSTLGTVEVGDIEIAALRDTSIVSYNGNVLHVEPVVTAGYSEEEMNYAWYIHGGQFDEDGDVPGGYRTNCISEEKVLDYEVNLPSGVYTLTFEAMADNGYAKTTRMSLTVSTPFSQGFYLLKETADGNTEVDLLTQDGLRSDLLTEMQGVPLDGKPLGMSIVYASGYINEDNQQLESGNVLHVSSEDDYRGFRTEDMGEVFNLSNLAYTPFEAGEVPLNMIENISSIYMATNKGIYTTNNAYMGETSSKFGLPMYEGGSKHFFSMAMSYYFVFWNEMTHSLCDAHSSELPWELPAGIDQAALSCLASGMNVYNSIETAWFLLEDGTSGKRLLALVSGDMYSGVSITELREVPVGTHLAEGNLFASVGMGAYALYVVDGNLLYMYNLGSGREDNVPLNGLDGGTITYIGNNYMNSRDFYGADMDGNFNYLLVATGDANSYKLHFYDNLVSGAPAGTPFQVIDGMGALKGVRYLSMTFDLSNWMNASNMWTGEVYGPCYPFEM